MNKISRYLEWMWLAVLLLTPLVLWILPRDFFDDTSINTCLSVILFDMECHACGMTRAMMHFHHFDFEMALYFNWLIVIVYPLLIVVWVLWLRASLKRLGVYMPYLNPAPVAQGL